jgi:ATP-dependent Clp endopeptidase proteolytic subunit ClpP
MKTIKIQGEIGWDVLAQEVETDLKNVSGDIVVELDSPGGDVFEGVKIHNLLKDYDKGKVSVVINGVAASMGSYIAMAGDEIKAYDNAVFMIHNPWTVAIGDYVEMRKTADVLEGLAKLLANKYIKKTGKSENEIKSLMDDESWFFGEEIKSAGFADEIISTDEKEDKQSLIALKKEQFKAVVRKMKEREEEVQKEKIAALAQMLNKQTDDKENKKQKASYELAKAKLNLLKRSLNG